MRSSRRRALALVAALLAALSLGEASGLARAVEYDVIVHCCCGDHDEGTRCHCKRCPGHGQLRIVPSSRERPDAPDHTSLDECHGRGRLASALPSPFTDSLPGPLAPSLTPPRALARPRALDPLPLDDRRVVAVRPPP